MANLNMEKINSELNVIDRNMRDGNYDRAIRELELFKGRMDKIIEWLKNNKG
jgi:hypothetical protein